MKSWQIFLKKSAGNGSGFYCILAKSFKILANFLKKTGNGSGFQGILAKSFKFLANFLKKQETEVACKVF